MEYDIKASPVTTEYEIGSNEVFVLVLKPTQYEKDRGLDAKICGRSIIDWVKSSVSSWHHKFVPTNIDDDVLTVFRENITGAKYTVVIYADMPLLEKAAIEQAVEYASAKSANAVALPRGWVFNTEYVKQSDDFSVTEYIGANPENYMVAFNDAQIAKCREIMQTRINFRHIMNGVNIISLPNTYIDCDAEIDTGCVVEPNTYIIGPTKIGKNVKILLNSRIENSKIGGNTVINSSQIYDSTVGTGTQIGPMAHIRPQSIIGDGAKIGNFVEIKKSVIGDGTKVSHMTYIGDGTVGKNCNIGCGVIFCNYDGKEKHQTTIGDNVFVGSNSCLVAPLSIGDNAFIAAGSVITDTVPADALAIARARQAIKENWNKDENN
jgi:bifunctional UDP-N-acetylglucosamine pyrophosphorylase/glucosamine-1-phosphate N-acetyltransferase